MLEQAQLKLVQGRKYGLVGRNGIGKTTLINAVTRKEIEKFPQNIHILQVEQEAILHVAPNLSCLTYLNLLEVSGVSSGSGVIRSALPSLEELVLGGQYEGGHASGRSGRVMISCGGG